MLKKGKVALLQDFLMDSFSADVNTDQTAQMFRMICTFVVLRVSKIPSHHIKKALKHLESENTVSSCKIHFPSVLEPF